MEMNVVTDSTSVEREVLIAAAPETVWELLTDARQMKRWMGQAATLDLRRGGRYRVEGIPRHIASGEFVEIDAPRRLVYTWEWDEGDSLVPAGSTTVMFELVPRGSSTLLRFIHRGLPSVESAASHAEGWDHYLERLALAGAGIDPGPDSWITTMSTKDAVQGYFDGLRHRDGWQSFLSDGITFASFTSPVKQVIGKDRYLEATKRFY